VLKYDAKKRKKCELVGKLALEWQHRHNEDAEAETRGALDETRADAQQEDGKDDTAQILIFLKKGLTEIRRSPHF